MAQWLQDWAEVLSAFGTLLMMFAWVFYAQFAIFAYLSQRRARVVIDQTAERTLDTKFVVVNLSGQPVYISCIMIVVNTGDDVRTKRITTYSHFADDEQEASPKELEADLRHGSLDPGSLLMIGGSGRLLSWLLESGTDDDFGLSRDERLRQAVSEVEHFDIRVIAMAGNEDKPIASRRRFLIERRDDGVTIYPAFHQTQHFNTWMDRSTVTEWSEYCLRC